MYQVSQFKLEGFQGVKFCLLGFGWSHVVRMFATDFQCFNQPCQVLAGGQSAWLVKSILSGKFFILDYQV